MASPMSVAFPKSPRLSSSSYNDDVQIYSHADFDSHDYGPQDDVEPPYPNSPPVSYDGTATHLLSDSTSAHPLRHSRSASVVSAASRRDRARAASVFNPASPFVTDVFDEPGFHHALDEDGQDEDAYLEVDDVELAGMGKGRGTAAAGATRRAARSSFQSLTPQEIWWMSASSLAVMGLTTGAIVLCFVG